VLNNNQKKKAKIRRKTSAPIACASKALRDTKTLHNRGSANRAKHLAKKYPQQIDNPKNHMQLHTSASIFFLCSERKISNINKRPLKHRSNKKI
jgi:hypothetical protein